MIYMINSDDRFKLIQTPDKHINHTNQINHSSDILVHLPCIQYVLFRDG